MTAHLLAMSTKNIVVISSQVFFNQFLFGWSTGVSRWPQNYFSETLNSRTQASINQRPLKIRTQNKKQNDRTSLGSSHPEYRSEQFSSFFLITFYLVARLRVFSRARTRDMIHQDYYFDFRQQMALENYWKTISDYLYCLDIYPCDIKNHFLLGSRRQIILLKLC